MTTTIPRAEVDAIAAYLGRYTHIDGDLTVGEVRELAEQFRSSADDVDGFTYGQVRLHGVKWRAASTDVRGLADDLDALADRYEREAAQ